MKNYEAIKKLAFCLTCSTNFYIFIYYLVKSQTDMSLRGNLTATDQKMASEVDRLIGLNAKLELEKKQLTRTVERTV